MAFEMPLWGWIAAAVGGAAAVAGVAYAASGGATTPATGNTGSTSGSTGGTTGGSQTGGTTPVGGTAGTTPVDNQAIIIASQNALQTIAQTNKVPMLTYTVGLSSGNVKDPDFISALQVYQHWLNGQGGYTPPGGKAVMLNTSGILDYATVAALLNSAATM